MFLFLSTIYIKNQRYSQSCLNEIERSILSEFIICIGADSSAIFTQIIIIIMIPALIMILLLLPLEHGGVFVVWHSAQPMATHLIEL